MQEISFGKFMTILDLWCLIANSCKNFTGGKESVSAIAVEIIKVTKTRELTTGKFLVRPLQCWGRICPLPGWNRVKISENLGATAVALVALAGTSLKTLIVQAMSSPSS